MSSAVGTPSQAGRSPPSGSRNGRFRCTGPGARSARAERRRDRLVRDLAQHETLLAVALGIGRVGHRQVGLEPRARREHARLPGGLVRPDAAQLRRAIGRQQQQRHAGVVRFERGRQQVRRGGARRADHDRRHPRLTSDAERGEPGDPLVDAHVQADRLRALELGGDEGESLRARSGAQDDVRDAELDERARRAAAASVAADASRGRPDVTAQPTAPR